MEASGESAYIMGFTAGVGEGFDWFSLLLCRVILSLTLHR